MSTKRGGKRRGAGRRSLLAPFDRLIVGSLVEEEIRRISQARFASEIDRAFSDVDLDLHWKRLHSVPLRQRKAWHQRLVTEGISPEDDDSPLSQLLADIRTDIGNRRYFESPRATPYGARRQALAEVATVRGLTVRMVEKCLEEYRAFLKDDQQE